MSVSLQKNSKVNLTKALNDEGVYTGVDTSNLQLDSNEYVNAMAVNPNQVQYDQYGNPVQMDGTAMAGAAILGGALLGGIFGRRNRGNTNGLTPLKPITGDGVKVCAGAGWDVSRGVSADLDLWALKANSGRPVELVYYRNKHTDSVASHGDNVTGKGEGDDEIIEINLSKLQNEANKLVIGVTIYNGKSKGQSFANIENVFIRIFDPLSGKEICKFDTNQIHREFYGYTSVVFGELVFNGRTWDFHAIGQGCGGSTPKEAIKVAYGVDI